MNHLQMLICAGVLSFVIQADGPEVRERTAFEKTKTLVGAAMSQCWTELDGFYANGTKGREPTVEKYLECVERKLKEARRYVAPDIDDKQ